jgi:hypothetical protein
LDEAVALLLGKAPEVVNYQRVEPHREVSRFAAAYCQMWDWAARDQTSGQLSDPVLPAVFIAWAKRSGVAVPEELEAAVSSRGDQWIDWQARYNEVVAQSAARAERDQAVMDQLCEDLAVAVAKAAPLPKEKGIGTRERETFLQLFIAMAVGFYGYVPGQAYGKTVTQIVHDLHKIGLSLDPDTVRNKLQEAEQLWPPQPDGGRIPQRGRHRKANSG